MRLDEQFIELILNDFTLNKAQCKILGLDFPLEENWDSLILQKDISEHDVNLLLLLTGKIALKTQDQIIKNYNNLLEYKSSKKKKSTEDETPKVETKTTQSVQNNEDSNISIYCDGACSGNPGEAGSGVVVYANNQEPVLYYGDYVKNGTNNIAELNALYKALLICEETKSNNKITILSDSKYSIDCISTWAYGWKAKNWTKKSGEIKNLELIKKAHYLFEDIKDRIIIKHVKGHSGVEGNELADRMAVLTIKRKNQNYEQYSGKSIQEVLSLTSY